MKKFGLLICLFSVLFVQCSNKSQRTGSDNGNGNNIIDTSDVFFASSSSGEYMDRTGKIVIKLKKVLCSEDFSEDLARVEIFVDELHDSFWGYIDKTGKFVIKPQFYNACDFSEGLAAVEVWLLGEFLWGYIDKTGDFIIKPRFSNACDFSEGLARVCVETEDTLSHMMRKKWGYINRSGKYVIEPQFDDAFDFSEGLARVYVGNQWGYIDKTGNFVIELPFDDVYHSLELDVDGFLAYDFSEGLARVGDFSGYSEGLARAGVYTGIKWGYIDKTGKFVIEPQFSRAGDFCEGLARVKINGKWGYIDKTGEFIVVPQFVEAGDFSENLALVDIGPFSRWGCIDKTGKIVFMIDDRVYNTDCCRFSNGLVKIGWDTYIDKTGKCIKPHR